MEKEPEKEQKKTRQWKELMEATAPDQGLEGDKECSSPSFSLHDSDFMRRSLWTSLMYLGHPDLMQNL